MESADKNFMRRALELAARGRGSVEPNPMVGAVVVRDDQIVGEGSHQRFGGPHAEIFALDEAGENANGATLYVTLEPCCHHGKTPPCTDRILAAGIRRVVMAMRDPFPAVAGKGVEFLQRHGKEIVVGCLEQESRQLNAPYLTLLDKGRPFIHLKWAMSLDGRTATTTGDSKWITGPLAREHGHQFRGLVDGILVGIGTAMADDPLLTPRLPGDESPRRVPVRIVLDSRGRLRSDSQLVQTAKVFPTLVALTNIARPADVARLSSLGCECIVFRPDADGRVPLVDLAGVLGSRKMTHLLVEGGSSTIGSFVDEGLVDSLRIYVAPMVMGGAGATPAVAGIGWPTLADSLRFQFEPPVSVGPDLFLAGSVVNRVQESLPTSEDPTNPFSARRSRLH
ncbi:bifunctional diaminohydroxyphosphoribosylaminopyrimidine deaminase/5-amino-6-(5-phosphoribosylamino)uracil reductase RibD [bacterium]|nr:bifunctional diaminohydroxyphosphoribosylaminopyrimidine deaminase/5-amino-6-(5-phosphoribosylamino)uracil reductase RibD [bacterium]